MTELEALLAVGVPILNALLALLCSGHAVLNKREARSAIAWCGVIWLTPFLGSALYVLFGVNRIKRRAHALRDDLPELDLAPARACSTEELSQTLAEGGSQLLPLVRLVGEVSGLPVLAGNDVRPLRGGDEAYPAMLAAIEEATSSITLCTYIFDSDQVGLRFVEALGAVLEVRVLVDGVGARYSLPTVIGALRRAAVPTHRFLPTLVPWRFHYANLRSHRKLLVVDGRIGFTGGMNIRAGTQSGSAGTVSIQDLHFQLRGPVVGQLQAVFAQDWVFTSGEALRGPPWFVKLEHQGPALARAVPDGPDEDFDKLRLTLLGALACARDSILIVTPYFVPDAALLTALTVAALRGVSVDVILPARNNLRLVQWASTALMWQILEHGCRVWLSPPPFDHSKLLVVDGCWSFVGSANWDARSLRLNFELNVECYDRVLAASLTELVEAKRSVATQVTFSAVEARSLPTRLRDGAARLLTPYL